MPTDKEGVNLKSLTQHVSSLLFYFRILSHLILIEKQIGISRLLALLVLCAALILRVLALAIL